MENKVIFNRNELISEIKRAKKRVRVLGAVSFDLPYKEILNETNWLGRINNGDFILEIICESESDLNYNSLISVNKKVSGQDRSFDIGSFMRIKNEPKIQIRDELVRCKSRHIEPKGDINERPDEVQCFSIRTCYWRIPIPVLNIDDDFYITFSLTKFSSQSKFEKLTSNHIWYDEFHKYFHAYFEINEGARKYSTEVTEKDNLSEVILMYNDKRHCLGQLPRQSFLDITKSKLVIWGMIFTRDGRVLIHKRGKNAKDNRDMWDKSIGGHVDMEKDTVDTVKAAAREMLEELYKIESEDQGYRKANNIKEINPDIPLFLGEWRDEVRQTLPFREIKSNKDAIYCFRLNYDFSERPVDSPRILPNGQESPVKCFVDMYTFVMNEGFNEKNLENSSFKLFELHELYDCFLGDNITYFSKDVKKEITEKFKLTPDLRRILSGELWTDLNIFADYLKDGLDNK